MGFSTHILDIAAGRPAAHVKLTLSYLRDSEWQQIGSGLTDDDGRCRTLLGETPLNAGTYCIRFETDEYFQRRSEAGLYPYVEIVFIVRDASQHYHVPLLLTPNGYTTYRGS